MVSSLFRNVQLGLGRRWWLVAALTLALGSGTIAHASPVPHTYIASDGTRCTLRMINPYTGDYFGSYVTCNKRVARIDILTDVTEIAPYALRYVGATSWGGCSSSTDPDCGLKTITVELKTARQPMGMYGQQTYLYIDLPGGNRTGDPKAMWVVVPPNNNPEGTFWAVFDGWGACTPGASYLRCRTSELFGVQ